MARACHPRAQSHLDDCSLKMVAKDARRQDGDGDLETLRKDGSAHLLVSMSECVESERLCGTQS